MIRYLNFFLAVSILGFWLLASYWGMNCGLRGCVMAMRCANSPQPATGEFPLTCSIFAEGPWMRFAGRPPDYHINDYIPIRNFTYPETAEMVFEDTCKYFGYCKSKWEK